jgi:AbiJ N-terminal domain 4
MERRRFSERYGHVVARDTIQSHGLDAATRTAIWNCLLETAFSQIDLNQFPFRSGHPHAIRIRRLWSGVLELPLDDLSGRQWWQIQPDFREFIASEEWYHVYDLLEGVVQGFSNEPPTQAALEKLINNVLARYTCGYRLVSGRITPITSESELVALTQSLNDKNDAVAQHFSAALALMSDRTAPDFRNSIKESISAVEAIAREVSGKPKATLADALKALKAKHPIHPALEKALQSLYGFAGDESGIRHALTEESTVDLADAKFMLVVCSAFCNFLRETTSSVN